MAKKVSFGAKPVEKSVAVEQWVESREPFELEGNNEENRENGEPTKRLTIDIPASLHKRVKTGCAMRGVKMVDEIRRLLEEHFPA